MSLPCWKDIGSPKLDQSPTMLKAYDGRYFTHYGILCNLPIELGSKTMNVEVEFINAPLDYNLLLGRSWFYAMTIVASSVFQLLSFPHNRKIVTINQLDYYNSDLHSPPTSNIPLVGKSTYVEVGASLFKDSSLMGTFTSLQPPAISSTSSIHMISLIHLDNSPDSLSLHGVDETHHVEESMPLMEIELFYNVVHYTSSPMAPVRKFQPCQFFSTKTHSHLASLHLVVIVGPFSIWGLDFMHCNLT